MAGTVVITLLTRHIIVIILLMAIIVCIQVVLKQGRVSIHWTQLFSLSYCIYFVTVIVSFIIVSVKFQIVPISVWLHYV